MNWSRLLRYSGLALLLGVLVTGPFFRGLFFWTELLAAIVAVSVGFVLWLIGRRLGDLPSGIPGGAAGWGLLALLGCYLVQFAWAVYPRGNLDWVLRVAAAWMAYVMARAESGPALRRWLGWGFVLSAAGVAVMGFLEYSGYFVENPEMMQVIKLVSPGSRMYTTFQYFNAGAAYLVAAVFCASGLALEDGRRWITSLATGLITLLSLAFFFTLSRGAVVVLPLGLLALLAGLAGSRRWHAILLMGASWMPALAVVRYVGSAALAHQVSTTFLWVGGGVVAGAVLGFVVPYFLQLRPRTQALFITLAVSLSIAGLLLFQRSGSLLPDQASRLKDISLNTKHVELRFIYVQDALRIVADHPLGQGGWGWAKVYKEYQTFDYTARETHNHYVQMAVEAGLPAVAFLLAMILSGLWVAWRNREGNEVAWAMASGVIFIAAHSAIDFNLSFGLIWLLWLTLLGASASPLPDRYSAGLTVWPAFGLGLIASVVAAFLFLGSLHMDQARALLDEKRVAEAQSAARRAHALDRWDSQPLLILGGINSLERATHLDPKNARLHFDLSVLYEQNGAYQNALLEAREALRNQPILSSYYGKVASVTGKLMVDALHNSRLDEANRLARDLVQLGEEFSRRKAVADPQQHLWTAPKMEMGAEFQLRYGQALYLAGHPDQAEPYLVNASRVGLLGSEGELWLYALYERRQDTNSMARLAGKPWVRFREQNPVYKAIRNR